MPTHNDIHARYLPPAVLVVGVLATSALLPERFALWPYLAEAALGYLAVGTLLPGRFWRVLTDGLTAALVVATLVGALTDGAHRIPYVTVFIAAALTLAVRRGLPPRPAPPAPSPAR